MVTEMREMSATMTKQPLISDKDFHHLISTVNDETATNFTYFPFLSVVLKILRNIKHSISNPNPKKLPTKQKTKVYHDQPSSMDQSR
jgi:hypothetical protein